MYQNHVLYVNVTRCYCSRLGCCFNVSTEWRGGGNEGVETNRVTPAKRVFRVDQGRSKCHITWLSLFGTSLILIAFPHTCFNVGFFFFNQNVNNNPLSPTYPPLECVSASVLGRMTLYCNTCTRTHKHMLIHSGTHARSHIHEHKHTHMYTNTHV